MVGSNVVDHEESTKLTQNDGNVDEVLDPHANGVEYNVGQHGCVEHVVGQQEGKQQITENGTVVEKTLHSDQVIPVKVFQTQIATYFVLVRCKFFEQLEIFTQASIKNQRYCKSQ